MKRILKYKLFSSSEEFEQFQQQEGIMLCSVYPIARDLTPNNEQLTMSVQIFITYYEED